MSRSYRYHPWAKCAGDTSFKKLYNRKLRRTWKPEDPLPQGNNYKKLNESYNIADYRYSFYWDEYKDWYGNDKLTDEELKGNYKKLWSK